MTTGEIIDELAKAKKINLRKLADAAGVSYNTLYSIVKRKSKNVDFDTVQKIAIALNVHPYTLLPNNEIAILEAKFFDIAVENAHEFKALGYTFSDAEISLIQNFFDLNEEGQQKAIERVEELTEIPKYQARPPQTEEPPEE